MRFVNIYRMLTIRQSRLPKSIAFNRRNRDDAILFGVYIALNGNRLSEGTIVIADFRTVFTFWGDF